MTLANIKETTRTISEHTPITTALALTICYVCYWFGSEQAATRVRLDANEETQKQLITVVTQLADVARTNALRIDQLEKDIEARP